VSPDEQERRLRDRVDDGRKIWKLSPMDLKSYDRWDDCTKARDEMFAASDPGWAPWYVARPEEKKRARLNVIRHLLDHVPHRVAPAPKVKLPVDAPRCARPAGTGATSITSRRLRCRAGAATGKHGGRDESANE